MCPKGRDTLQILFHRHGPPSGLVLINRQHIPEAVQISSAATLVSQNVSELSRAWSVEVCDDESAVNDELGAGEDSNAKPMAPTCAESSEDCEGERGLYGWLAA